MSPFSFHAVQTLEIGPDDCPQIDVQNGRLVLTASRGGDQIMITAPINSVIQTTSATTVKSTRRARRRRINPDQNYRTGENHVLAKLTEADVRKIRALAADPSYASQFTSIYTMSKEMAKGLNVHFTTVMKIIEGRSWRHVK